MGNLFLSFLGKGYLKSDGHYDYDPTIYELNGRRSEKTKFVQVAEVQLLKPKTFDRALIVVTKVSYRLHFKDLYKKLTNLGVSQVHPLEIQEDFTPQSQWEWFRSIIDGVGTGDHLTVDFTHGYRIVAIIFSNAINFAMKVRGVSLDAAYYGAFEKNRECPPIIDMRDFFVIHEWAEGVSRLVDDADARKLAGMARKTPSFQFEGIADEVLIEAITNLSEKVRNVDIHRVGAAAEKVVQSIHALTPRGVEMDLLHIILDKFKALAMPATTKDRYDDAYFDLQVKIIRLLLEHGLLMQAFTAMRELIGSIGLVEVDKAKVHTSKGRNQRVKAEVFLSMLQIEREKWNFTGDRLLMCERLFPYYEKLESIRVVAGIKEFLPELIKYRNGFDHAWTSQAAAPSNIAARGDMFLSEILSVLSILKKHGLL